MLTMTHINQIGSIINNINATILIVQVAGNHIKRFRSSVSRSRKLANATPALRTETCMCVKSTRLTCWRRVKFVDHQLLSGCITNKLELLFLFRSTC